ncbi:hypothetical protein K8F61_05285 [Microbacterium resistens]|uniref:Replicative helicase inhibitor G39P N-terminal domain-containing protein n=1 Tax=Microbacterium resistens TaxID=156977 RepID=A0ABY3RU61_9MICO|nr:hypothetical protein [Microbacterium resistens]UGS27603.1 hypothetical protein K8F61_05285 [Microbacterium resistens]
MNVQETTDLLTRIQIIDNRRVEEATVLAWFELVADLDHGMAVEAAKLHFRESTAYLTPAHVRANVERIRFAALGPVEDEWGNLVDPEPAALEAAQRLAAGRKAVER